MPAARDLGRIFRSCRCIDRGQLNKFNGGPAWAGLPAGRRRKHAPRHPAAGLSCGSPETMPVICEFVFKIGVRTRPLATAPTASCPSAAARPPGPVLAAQRPRPPPVPLPPLQGLPYSLTAFESFDYNLEAETNKRARSWGKRR